ncbi:MAG: hypothetical protein ACJ72D_20510 [Marmoricola sp.]
MKKYVYVVLAAIAAAVVSLGLSSSAQAYPDARIDLTVNHQVVYSGDSFTATGTTDLACAMDLEWNNVVRHGATAKKFAATYVAPVVTKVTSIPVEASCVLANPGAGKAASGATSMHRDLTVTVLPRSSGETTAPHDASADLPSSGGPNPVFLLSGLVLLLAGATAVTVARRSAEEVELPGQTA